MNDTLPRTSDGKFIPGIIYSPETMFKPGQDPLNKGKKFPGSGNKASFRKGNMPHNTLKDSAITIRTTNWGNTYKFIRLELGKWEYLQKVNWIELNGPIPEGKVLACKNGDTLNADPSNWELITRAELAIRNRAHRITKTKNCIVCGTEFNTIFHLQIYCSTDCHNSAKRKNYTPAQIVYSPINCQVCGAEFTPSHHHTRICSDECHREQNRIYNQKFRSKQPKTIKVKFDSIAPNLMNSEKDCVICQVPFIPKSNCQVTCSDECAHENIRIKASIRRAAIVKPLRRCSKCGDKFTSNRNNLTICENCKTKAPRTITCLVCGKQFTKSGKGVQLLCSDECIQKRRSERRKKYGYNRKPAATVILHCKLCNSEFEARNGSKYCSDECKRQAKVKLAREWRALIGTTRSPGEAIERPVVMSNCLVCDTLYPKKHKTLYCSDECRLELKRKNAREYNRTRSKSTSDIKARAPKKLKEPKPFKEPVLKKCQNPKAEREAVLNMLELNRNMPIHDRETLKKKNIVSPDLSQMQFSVYDPKMKIRRFFRTEEKYNHYLNNLSNAKAE